MSYLSNYKGKTENWNENEMNEKILLPVALSN